MIPTPRHAEVKRYMQNCIHLSSNEYAFAVANRHTYELFLVDAADEIRCLTGVDFNNTDQLNVVTSEFVVSFRLKGADVEVGGAILDQENAVEQPDAIEEPIAG